MVRNKARHIAQGSCQHEGIDYTKTLIPVARLNGIKRTIRYTDMCSSVQDHGIKFEL